MTNAQQVIWLVGPFPPPLHGQAVYNAAIAAHLRQHGELRVLATGEGILSKIAGYGRILLVALFRMRRSDVVYTSMPGQMAAWLFAMVVAALRLRGIRHFVHHHSFRSIVLGPLGVMRLVVGLGGRLQHHILLSPVMRDRFAALYLGADGAGRAHALSNAWLFCPAVTAVPPRPPRPLTLGHMSVLTRHKGVDTVIRLFRQMASAVPDLRLIIAGPLGDETLGGEIADVVADFPDRVDYRGTLSGAAKQGFYADIDLFLLPTRLIDEAEPLVMLESYAAGVEFMATDRGCIVERLRRPDHLLTGDEMADAARIIAILTEAAADWEASRQACGMHAAGLHAQAEIEARTLFTDMLTPAVR
jgi:glycosyltransferase involved in cell wall biosynthesis